MSAHTTTRRRVRRNALIAVSAMFVVAQTVGAGHTSAQDADVDEPVTMLYQTDPTPFTLDDIIGDTSGVTEGSSGDVVIGDDDGEDTSGNIVNGKNGGTLYPIDSAFTFDVLDFYGAVGRDRDGLAEEGWAGPVTTEIDGETLTGIQLSDVATDEFKSGAPLGTWAAGLGDSAVKASTEHFTVMEGILTCHQTLPYDFWESEEDYFDDLADGLDSSVPADTTAALAELGLACVPLTDPTELETLEGETGDDVLLLLEPNEDFVTSDMLVDPDRNYSVTKKDDGKLLFRWGQMVKRPTDIRFQKTLPLPEEWLEVPDGQKGYQVSKAELVVRHRVTNNPNDQIRPEDWENEAATGWLPGYTTTDGYRYSDTGCYEGDGDYIPAGTIYKYPTGVTTEVPAADLAEGYTAAWYTTIDRDPFQWAYDTGTDVVGSRVPDDSLGELISGPRWRLTSNKFGQDLPGLEIPSEACTPPPYQQGETRYDTGEMTTTIINLLDWGADAARWDDAVSPLAWSAGWTHTWATADVPGMIVEEEDAARCSIDLGDGSCVTELGTTLTENFDVTFYVKGDQKPLEVYDVQLILEYNEAPAVTEIYDFGDAPETYGEAAAIATGPTLGATIDAELAPQYSTAADGDDLTGVDDEDGVDLTADGTEATATITITGTGYVQGWLDDDLSGTFDADELIVVDLETSAAVTFAAPAEETYARFRLSTEPGAEPTGLSGSGEVEDYVVPAAVESEPPEPPEPPDDPEPPDPEPPEPEPVADFMTLTMPTRILDTRTGYVAPDGRTVAAAMLEGGSDVVVPVVGRAGVPDEAEAVMVNLTITGATEPGHATIWDCGDRPATSSVNYSVGAFANEVMVALSDQGTVCVSTSSEAHVVVDLVAFAPLDSDYMVLPPTRVADTRVGFRSADGEFVGTGPVAGGSVVTVPLAGRAGVPEDAEAVMVNLTITGATEPGHATIAACGTAPITSSVNYTTGAYASEVFVKPSSRGDVCVYVHTTAHVVLDVVGAAPAGSNYDALTPARVADTRVGFRSADGEFVGTGPVAGGSVVTVPLAGRAGVPEDAEAVMVNLTITGATEPGHATIWGCGTRPNTSSVNYRTGAYANEVLVKPSATGDVCVYVHTTAHVVLDVVGDIPSEPEA